MTKPATTDLVKLYYRIGEVSQIVGVQPHVLRYWESEFRSIRPQKSQKGQRIYSRRDVEKLMRVKDLLKNQGFTIAGARKRLRSPITAEADANEPIRPSTEAVEPTIEAAIAGETLLKVSEAPASSVEDALEAAAPAPTSVSTAVKGKSLRRALLSLRKELLALQRDLREAK